MDNTQPESKNLTTPHALVFCINVLQQILNVLTPIDYRQEAGLGSDEKLSLKHLIVITVSVVLQCAQSLGCGLCRRHDFIYAYNGAFWELIDREALSDFLGEAARRLGVDAITASYHAFRRELYKQFLAVASFPTPESPEGVCQINLRNGTFEVTPDGAGLREFRREDFLTYQLPFDYDPTATAPLLQKFLDRVLPDIARQLVLAEYLAYVFTRLKLEKTLMLLGLGANGKSVIFDIILALFGIANVTSYSLESLSHDYHRAKLANKLLNYSSESSTRLQSDVFKKLTSGEPVEARLPYGQPFIMSRYARLAFNCNELPRDVEHTEAFFRRFLLLPFDVTIPEEEQDKQLAEKIIKSELSGVFNWVLEGLQRLLAQGNFTPCEASRLALEQYRKESDPVALFLADENYQQSGEFTEGKVLYQKYKAYCLNNGYRPLGRNNFYKRLGAHKVVTQRLDVGLVAFIRSAWGGKSAL